MQNQFGKDNTKVDPVQLQRLIDGELSSHEVRELVELADGNPALWRTIGCAFTEDQLFRKQFEAFADEIEQPNSAGSTRTNRPTRSGQPQETNRPLPPADSAKKETRTRSLPLVWQLTTAACFALAGLIGYLIGSDSTPTPDLATGDGMIASIPPSDEELTPVALEPEYRMELLTPDGEAINGEVDLYRYNDLHRFVGRDQSGGVTLKDVLPPSGFSPEVRQRLSRSGYEINESTNYMSGRLQDGRQFIVPVRSIRFDQGH